MYAVISGYYVICFIFSQFWTHQNLESATPASPQPHTTLDTTLHTHTLRTTHKQHSYTHATTLHIGIGIVNKCGRGEGGGLGRPLALFSHADCVPGTKKKTKKLRTNPILIFPWSKLIYIFIQIICIIM